MSTAQRNARREFPTSQGNRPVVVEILTLEERVVIGRKFDREGSKVAFTPDQLVRIADRYREGSLGLQEETLKCGIEHPHAEDLAAVSEFWANESAKTLEKCGPERPDGLRERVKIYRQFAEMLRNPTEAKRWIEHAAHFGFRGKEAE